jgi:hypothetical protein
MAVTPWIRAHASFGSSFQFQSTWIDEIDNTVLSQDIPQLCEPFCRSVTVRGEAFGQPLPMKSEIFDKQVIVH